MASAAGKTFLIDLEQGRIIEDEELKDPICVSQTYRQRIESARIKLEKQH